MTLAEPIALLFLGLSVPILLLYLLRQRRPTVRMSSLLLWEGILSDKEKKPALSRLRRLLSLLAL